MVELWRIGSPERGPLQFSDRWYRGAAGEPPPFVVGSSDPAKDWPARQPAPSPRLQRPKTAVSFALDAVADAGYDLALYLLNAGGPVPCLEVQLNGLSGRVEVSPRRGPPAPLFPTGVTGGWAEVVVPLAPGLFRRGANTIAFTTAMPEGVEGPPLRPPHPVIAPYLRHGIGWCGLALAERQGAPAVEPQVWIDPLPFYVRRDGGTFELVDVVIDVALPIAAGSVSVGIDGTAPVATPPVHLGRHRARLLVPDGGTAREIAVSLLAGDVKTDRHLAFRPARKWVLHLIPHAHLDLGFTDYQGKVAELHSRNLDKALCIMAEHPDWRFSLDGSWVLSRYLETRSSPARELARSALADGSLATNAFSCLFLSGLASLEEMVRALHGSNRLARAAGRRPTYANLTDVPSYSSALPSVLAAAGIGAFAGLANHGRAENSLSEELHMSST